MTRSGDAGSVETLPLAMLTFVVGSLVITHAWAVVSTREHLSAAARAGARAYVEAQPRQADAAARQAVRNGLGDRPDEFDIEIDGHGARCLSLIHI